MLGSLLIVFREVIEAGLIVGIVMAVTRGVPVRGRWIGGGILIGLAGAGLVAAFIGVISAAFEGIGQELFNAAILGIAVLMLAWHNIWMARHGRELAARMREAGQAVRIGAASMVSLMLVVAIAIWREGGEVVMFLYGIAVQDGGSLAELALGSFIGLALGAALSLLTYFGLVKISSRHLFGVTSALIVLLAAGMAAQTAAMLEQAGLVTVLGQTLWNTSAFLSDASVPGKMLHTLIGYSDRPTQLQGVVYVATLFLIVGSMKIFAPAKPTMRSDRIVLAS